MNTTICSQENINDFWNEINASEESVDNICLISHQPLKSNYVKLPCKHCFNYQELFDEVYQKKCIKKKYTIGIKCPYCRLKSDTLLIEIPGYPKYKNVTSKTNFYTHRTCEYINKSGKKSGMRCNSSKCYETHNGCFCNKHHTVHELKDPIIRKLYNNNTIKKLQNILTEKSIDFSPEYTKLDLVKLLINNETQ